MEKPTLYRRRYIPEETVCLKDDEIIKIDDEVIVTRWKVLKPRTDFAGGVSCFFLKKGFKVSRFFDSEGKSVYIYCDIIETIHTPKENEYLFNDLLIDVIVYENGFVKVLDIGEVPLALERNLITVGQMKKALELTDQLLSIIYSGDFHELTKHLEISAEG